MAKQTNTVTIEEGQYCPLVGKEYVVIGPGEVRVTRYDNGHVNTEATRGSISPVRDAVRRKMERLSWGI
jgi:hypothetical protein